MADERTDTEHIWFEYGRWFAGYGSSMDPHRCAPEFRCKVRTVTTTVTYGPWTDKHGE